MYYGSIKVSVIERTGRDTYIVRVDANENFTASLYDVLHIAEGDILLCKHDLGLRVVDFIREAI